MKKLLVMFLIYPILASAYSVTDMAECVASLTVLAQYSLIKGDYPSKDRYSALSGHLGNVALSTLKGSNLKLYQSHIDALFTQYGSLPGLEKQRDYAQYNNQKLNCENMK